MENNHYFPPDSLHAEYLYKSGNTYQCPWKGKAFYYDIIVGDETLHDAAWTYPEPSEAARAIKGYYAFWKGVKIVA